jgi:hypothetical protein
VTWAEKTLWRNGATCAQCGRLIEKDERALVNPEAPANKKVRCLVCGSGDAATREDPIAGSSQLGLDKRNRGDKNLKGAVGEYLMGGYLAEELELGARVLTDRKVPGDSEANIDHVVVATSGVWIVDSKKWEGEIHYRNRGLSSSDPNRYLTVGGIDRTSHIAKIYRLVIPVAQVIGDRAVPVYPVLAFVESTWGVREGIHFKRGKGPYTHEGVLLSGGHSFIPLVNKTGPLSPEAVDALWVKLDRAMPPR